jgi:VIT1/CCC1 family predicted Fe2+/Mn2+ transporter
MKLREWMSADLNRVAFAVARSENKDELITECSYRLRMIANSVQTQIQKSGSNTMRQRLLQTGIQGASGFIGGFAGALISGGTPEVATAAAAVGFALSVTATALTTGGSAEATSVPVLYEYIERVNRPKRMR